MLLKTFQLVKNNWNINHKLLHKHILAMDKAYLRHVTESEQFQISFQYTDSIRNRQFNFCRQLTESVGTFLNRVRTNVEKYINKKKKNKANSDTIHPDTVVSVTLLQNSMPVDENIVCGDLFIPNMSNELVLRLLEKEYLIVVNSPWINTLTLPKSIMANFPVYPSKFEADLIDKSLSTFIWYKSRNKLNWEQVGDGFIYEPNNEDIKSYLKISCIPRNEHSEGPYVEEISEVCVEASPGHCPFETRHQFTKEKLKGKEFRVVTFNILADLYTDSDYSRNTLFSYCPVYALSMDYRKQLILKELIGYNADIICLQELDKKIFLNDIQPVFNTLGYSCSLQLKGGEVAEGLGFVFNKERFRFFSSSKMVYGEEINKNPLFVDIWNKISENPNLVERFTQRSTVIEVIVLESIENDELLVVANTHLYFHPDSDHIRLLQGGVAIIYVADILNKLRSEVENKRVSVVFCGDFNSVPECGIYKLYTTGHVPHDFVDWQSNAEEAVRNLSLSQPISLGSACGTPEFTNYTSGFAGCLDYIFYELQNLQVTQVIPLPSNEEIKEHFALPSIVHPSDHIALVADLKWI